MAYLLVESDRRQVEYFLRGKDGIWRQGTLGEMDILNLSCAGRPISFCLDNLYEDVALQPGRMLTERPTLHPPRNPHQKLST